MALLPCTSLQPKPLNRKAGMTTSGGCHSAWRVLKGWASRFHHTPDTQPVAQAKEDAQAVVNRMINTKSASGQDYDLGSLVNLRQVGSSPQVAAGLGTCKKLPLYPSPGTFFLTRWPGKMCGQ